MSLINEPRAAGRDSIVSLLGDRLLVTIRPGLYEVGHFGASDFLREYERYPDTTVGSYGVCDSAEQLLAACPELEGSDRQFVVTLTRVRRDDQSPSGGWRWRKWGPYIGTQAPQREYIHDEPNIEQVFVFRIYEKL